MHVSVLLYLCEHLCVYRCENMHECVRVRVPVGMCLNRCVCELNVRLQCFEAHSQQPQVQAASKSALDTWGSGWDRDAFPVECPCLGLSWLSPCTEDTGQYSWVQQQELKTNRTNSTSLSACLVHTGHTSYSKCTRLSSVGTRSAWRKAEARSKEPLEEGQPSLN